MNIQRRSGRHAYCYGDLFQTPNVSIIQNKIRTNSQFHHHRCHQKDDDDVDHDDNEDDDDDDDDDD